MLNALTAKSLRREVPRRMQTFKCLESECAALSEDGKNAECPDR